MTLDAIIVANADTQALFYPKMSWFGKYDNRMGEELTLNGTMLYSIMQASGVNVELIPHLDTDYRKFAAYDCNVVIVSTTFVTNSLVLRSVIRRVRAVKPDAFIIVGGELLVSAKKVLGEHPMREEEVIKEWYPSHPSQVGADLFVYSVQELLEFFGKKEKREAVDWETLPFKYLRPAVSVQASSGCRFKCKFCNFSTFSEGFSIKDMDVLMRELSQLSRRKRVLRVGFADDDFFLSSQHLTEFTDRYKAEGIRLTWSAFMRAGVITEKVAKALGEANCKFLYLGLESIDKDILKNMSKPVVPEQFRDAVDALNKNGISTGVFFMVGLPGETEETIRKNIEFINALPDYSKTVNLSLPCVFTVVPFSELDVAREKYGIKGILQDWTHDTMTSRYAKDESGRLVATARYNTAFTQGLLSLIATDMQQFKKEICNRQERFLWACKG